MRTPTQWRPATPVREASQRAERHGRRSPQICGTRTPHSPWGWSHNDNFRVDAKSSRERISRPCILEGRGQASPGGLARASDSEIPVQRERNAVCVLAEYFFREYST